jgi:hypothetical protein
VRWPKSKRVKNISFSAHREAMALPNGIDERVKMLNDLAKTQGAAKVTVASVRKAVAIKQGKAPTAKPGGSQSAKALDVLRDLTDHNGAGLISAIGNEQNSDKLDRLNASLTKVIGHVEKLRAKAARKTTPVKTTTPAAVKPKVAPANGARPKKKAGDLRGL